MINRRSENSPDDLRAPHIHIKEGNANQYVGLGKMYQACGDSHGVEESCCEAPAINERAGIAISRASLLVPCSLGPLPRACANLALRQGYSVLGIKHAPGPPDEKTHQRWLPTAMGDFPTEPVVRRQAEKRKENA